MADDTLSPFQSVIVKTRCAGPERLALARLREAAEEPGQWTVRRVLDAGLDALGYDPQRRIEEYEDHVAECKALGVKNVYEERKARFR